MTKERVKYYGQLVCDLLVIWFKDSEFKNSDWLAVTREVRRLEQGDGLPPW